MLYTWSLIEACGLLERPNVSRLACRSATDPELGLVHEDAYIEATKRAGHGEEGAWGRFGFGPGDNPIFPNMHEAGAFVAGASLVAAEAVRDGSVLHAFNAAGGLHHAMPARASGFCVYDDPAIAIAWLLDHGVHPIAYVDVDVHHGDGVQAIFYEDPRVLTVSIHQSGETLFPGTGSVDERGAGDAEGTAVNVPLQPGVGDRAWLAAFAEIVPPVVRAFAPKVLVTQLGCDTHRTDPLAQLRLSTAAYRETAASLHALAHEVTGGRWLATGRRRLPVGDRRPAGVDDRVRGDGRRRAPRRAARTVDRAGGARDRRRGPRHVLRAAARTGRARRPDRADDRRGQARVLPVLRSRP